MKKGSLFILYEKNTKYNNWELDEPAYEIKSLFPSIKIIQDIEWDMYCDKLDALEVFIESDEQYEMLQKYLELRKDLLSSFFDERKSLLQEPTAFDYCHAREVGYIPFVISSMIRNKYKELDGLNVERFSFDLHDNDN